jgi:hypothetical protein
VTDLPRRIDRQGQKLYVDNFFTSPELFDKLTKKKMNCCGTVRPNKKDMLLDLGHRNFKTKGGDIKVRTRGERTALIWKDEIDMHVLICTIHRQKVTSVTTMEMLRSQL